MPNREESSRKGRGAASAFWPPKSGESPGNYDRAGARHIPWQIGILIPSDVTVFSKTIANRGRTVAAGVVIGACVSAGDSKAVVWESVSSRTGTICHRISLQGSGESLRLSGGAES